jgi:TonB-dependent receptor
MLRPGRASLVAALLAAVTATAAHPQAGPATGAVRGVVWDRDHDAPLAGVRVSATEAPRSTVSSADGNFLLDGLAPGAYTLTFTREGYERAVLTGVVVVAGRLADVRVEMVQEIYELPEVVVTGGELLAGTEAALIEVRAAAVTIQDSVSAELLRKAAVTDVSGALKLVTGATVVEGKYATVRGLSDRYTGTTLNGLRVPSADPRRRAVQLDQFPTGTVENVAVTKTFTPDLQGDFTGGGVDIQTRSIPEQRFVTASLGLEYNMLATGEDAYLTYRGGGVSPFGVDDGSRDLPQEATEPLPPFPTFSAQPKPEQRAASADYDRLVRAFEPAMGVDEQAPGANYGFTVVGGNRHEMGPAGVWGYLGAFTYASRYDFYGDGQNNNVTRSDPQQGLNAQVRDESRGTEDVLLGALGSFVLRPSDHHEYTILLLANQAAEDDARILEQNLGGLSETQNQSLRYTERTVAALQGAGSHDYPGARDLELDWAASVNYARQAEPDVRFFRNTFDFTTLTARMPQNSTDAQNTRRIWRLGEEENGQAAANFALPFRQWSGLDAVARMGIYAESTDRRFDQDSFTYTFPTQFGSVFDPRRRENQNKSFFTAGGPEDLWTDVFTNPDRIGLATNDPPAPNQLLWSIVPLRTDVDYTGDQAISALYAMVDLPLAERWDLVAGARYETTDIGVVPETNRRCQRYPAAFCLEVIIEDDEGDRTLEELPPELATADIKDGAVLPSLGFIWEPRAAMNVRGTWSRTIARPTFRELAPVATEEFLFGDEFVGNPFLVLSEITNYDLRWEWFPSSGGILAASLFYKEIENPIEYISFSIANRSFVEPVNYERGSVRGIELEGRGSFGRLAPSLEGLWIGTNLTWLDSEVEVPADEQASLAAFGLAEETRRLQGQPAYVWNVNLTWDGSRTGTTVGVFFNLVGETLLTGAARGVEDGVPDAYEDRLGTLNLSVTQAIGKGWSVFFRAKNLTAPVRRSYYLTPDGLEATKSESDSARLFALGVSWTQ